MCVSHVSLIALSYFFEARVLALGVRLLSKETLLPAKNSTGNGNRWDSKPGPCR